MQKQVTNSFRTSPVSGLIGNINTLVPKNPVSLGPILRYICGAIEDYSFCLVNSVSFALVNVTNLNSKNSVGYSVLDPKAFFLPMFKGITLSLTFSLVPRPLTTLKSLSPVLRLKNRDFTWGRPFKGSEYMTVNFTAGQLRDLGIEDYLFDDLMFFYNNIGLVSKSFVQNPFGVYSSIEYSNLNTDYMRAAHFNKPVRAMFMEPIGNWKYNLNVWSKYRYLLFPEMFKDNSDDFYLYFVQHLHKRMPVSVYSELRWLTKEKSDSLYDFIYSGILKFVQLLNGSNSYSLSKDKDLFAVCFMLYESSGVDFEGQDLNDEMEVFVQSVMQTIRTDLNRRTMLTSLLSDIRSMCYDLINSSEQVDFIMEEVVNAASPNS